jgi:hypothetical protein
MIFISEKLFILGYLFKFSKNLLNGYIEEQSFDSISHWQCVQLK